MNTVEGCFDRLIGREKIGLQNELDRAGPSCPDKVSMTQLQEIAQKRGLKLTEVRLNWTKLRTHLLRPVLLVLRNGNVVVALRSDAGSDNRIVVFDPLDPSDQDFLLPREVLESAWDGVAIFMEQPPAAYKLFAQFASPMPIFIAVLGFAVFWPTVTGEEYYPVTSVGVFQQLSPETFSRAGSMLNIAQNTRAQHERSTLYKHLALETEPPIAIAAETMPDLSEVVLPLASNPIARVETTNVDAGLANGRDIARKYARAAAQLEQAGREPEQQSPEQRTPAQPAPADFGAAKRGIENLRSIASGPTSELAARSEAMVPDTRGAENPVTLTAHQDASAEAPEISALMARGDALFGTGDLASARLFYERAAEAGHGQAALRLGESYDPSFLAFNGIPVRGDAVLAARWYKKASDLGVPSSDILLNALAR